MKKISVVIVNWNGYKDTIMCLKSIFSMNMSNYHVEVIVVDNGSSDSSVLHISNAFPKVTMLALDSNLGFTGGNNRGIEYSMLHGADFIWLLNNDTIVNRDAVSLVNAFRDSHVGIAGSKIYFAAGHEYHKDRYSKSERGKVLWYAGGLIDWNNMYASHKGVDEIDTGQFDMIEMTPYVSGCSMMIKREVVDTIGKLDPRFYLYLEDLDYCLRAANAGFSLVYYPNSFMWHVNAGSSGGAGSSVHQYYQTRNRLLVGFRFAPLRTKLALFREALGFVIGINPVKKKAVIDAMTYKWGNQYEVK